jgi:hypothetical protein
MHAWNVYACMKCIYIYIYYIMYICMYVCTHTQIYIHIYIYIYIYIYIFKYSLCFCWKTYVLLSVCLCMYVRCLPCMRVYHLSDRINEVRMKVFMHWYYYVRMKVFMHWYYYVRSVFVYVNIYPYMEEQDKHLYLIQHIIHTAIHKYMQTCMSLMHI